MTERIAPGVRGFTLIELLVTIAIAAILLMVAVPSFVTFQRNSELTSAANTLLAALNTARGEAMKRNLPTLVTPLSGGDWSTGWRVWVDVDQSGDFDATQDISVSQRSALPTYITTSATGIANGTDAYARFNGSGYASSKSSTTPNFTVNFQRSDVSTSAQPEQTRRVKVAVTGRVRVCKPSSSSDATCRSDSDD